jgi:Apea-like HEPN
MHEDDKAILVGALEKAAEDYRKIPPTPSIIGPMPAKETLAAIAAAIDNCQTYKAVAGQVLFSGGSGPVLHSSGLASRLFWKGVQFEGNISEAADWLIRLLTTRETTGLFKTAIWGFKVDRDAPVSKTSRLMPFASLPTSYMQSKILERAQRCYDGSAWMAQTYYDLPTAAFVETIENVPYVSRDDSAFQLLQQLVWNAHELSILIQGACVGRPLAAACWFEYADREFEYTEWENEFTWLLPEIHPHVKLCTLADVDAIQASLASYSNLPEDQRARLFRSMERFRLSQCRGDIVDRVLDLTLAFEIAVSEKGDNAPPSWKVSVRSAQMIGGPIVGRQQIRSDIGALYQLRNQATHGGTLSATSTNKPADGIFEESCEIYVTLMKKLLGLGKKPDWKILELGPAS